MRLTKLLFLCICAITPIVGQVKNVQRIFTVTTKERATVGALDNNFANYLQRRRDVRDRLRWHTWQIITGPRVGGYTSGSFGREWEDFNLFSDANLSDNGFYLLRAALSRNPFGDDATPPNFAEVRYYSVFPGQERSFESLLLRARELYEKTPQPRNYTVFRLSNGGTQTLFIVWIPLDKLSAIQYPDRGVVAVLDDVVGNRLDGNIFRDLTSEILCYRPDLSYNYRP